MRVPHEEVGSIVSHPSARELPGTELLVTNCRTRDGENGCGTPVSPRVARKTARASPAPPPRRAAQPSVTSAIKPRPPRTFSSRGGVGAACPFLGPGNLNDTL